MADTLSYNEEPQTELNADEQNSLEVGEQMQQDQEQLLAGKYKSSEELEKAYLELQSKLGSQEKQEEVEDVEETVEDQPEPTNEQEPEQESETPELTPEDIDFLHDLAGGKDGYQSMLKWASDALAQKEIDMYDNVMEAGDPNSIYFAVQALVAKYNDATGSDGKLLTGKGSNAPDPGFRSQAELVQAMSDPRYDNDPAYRADVINKLEQSELNF